MNSKITLMRPVIIALCGTMIMCGCQLTPAMSPDNTEEGFFGKLKSSTNQIARSFGRSKTQQQRSRKNHGLNFPKAELTQENFAGVQFAMGRSLESEGDLQGAKSSYQAAIRNNSQDAAAYHRLALVLEKLGEGKRSGELLLKAAQLDPENAEVLCDLGYWYALREQPEDAVKYYESALTEDPNLARAHNNLGLLLARFGGAERAMPHFNAAGLTVAEARSNLGFANMQQHQWQQAEHELKLALQVEPSLQQARTLATTLDKLHTNREQSLVAMRNPAPASQEIEPQPTRGAKALQDLVREEYEQQPSLEERSHSEWTNTVTSEPGSAVLVSDRIVEAGEETAFLGAESAVVVESEYQPVTDETSDFQPSSLQQELPGAAATSEAQGAPQLEEKIQLTTASRQDSAFVELINPAHKQIVEACDVPEPQTELIVLVPSTESPQAAGSEVSPVLATDMPVDEKLSSPNSKLRFIQALKHSSTR